MNTLAVIPSAGFGRRMGGTTPKQFLEIAGRPILEWTLSRFEACPEVDGVILVVPAEAVEATQCQMNRFPKVVRVVAGGKERQDSVWAGLCAAADFHPEVVIVHDGVRPMITPALIAASVAEARKSGGAIVAVKVSDTIKRVTDGAICETVDRSTLWAAQTPQTFQFSIIQQAFERAIADGFVGTDEASLVERIGKPVAIVEGSRFNIKMTTPPDLEMAGSWLVSERTMG